MRKKQKENKTHLGISDPSISKSLVLSRLPPSNSLSLGLDCPSSLAASWVLIAVEGAGGGAPCFIFWTLLSVMSGDPVLKEEEVSRPFFKEERFRPN